MPLGEQDPARWDAVMIDEAEALLSRANRCASGGRYQLEAALQSAHAVRRRSGKADWIAIEVARRIRQRPESQDVTLIALTGWGQERDRRDSEAAGFDHHLIKPVDIDALQGFLGAVHSSGD